MRKNTTGVSALGLLVLFTMIFGCNKDKGKIESKLTAVAEAKLAILKLGLDTAHIVDMGTYYLVGGDIGVKKNRLNATLPRQAYYNANPFVSQSLQGVLTVRINDDVPSDGSNYDYRAAIPLAIQEWNNAGSGIHFTLVNTSTADITIHCQAVNDPNLYAFIDDWPVNGAPSHYISINTLCNYNYSTFTNEQKKWIMVHELGHALNIAHTQDYSQSYATKIGNSPDVDLNSVFNGGMAGNTYTGFSSWDLYAIKFLYPYYNVEKSGSFIKNDCGSGYAGNAAVIYTVPANIYTSTISQEDANQKAQNDISANGQAYANANGTCTAAASVNLITDFITLNSATATIRMDKQGVTIINMSFPSNGNSVNIPNIAPGNYKIFLITNGGNNVKFNFLPTNTEWIGGATVKVDIVPNEQNTFIFKDY